MVAAVPPPEGGGEGTPRPEKIVVELGKGRDLEIDYMMETTFWGPNGKQMTAAEFLTLLFGELPNFYKDEDDLRRIWSDPLTRIELLTRLEEHGFTTGDLRRIQELIAASESDLFDVLAFVSFDAERKTRSERASQGTTESRCGIRRASKGFHRVRSRPLRERGGGRAAP